MNSHIDMQSKPVGSNGPPTNGRNDPVALDAQLVASLHDRLKKIYPDRDTEALNPVLSVVEKYVDNLPNTLPSLPDQRDVVLITYGDQIHVPEGPSLPALGTFLSDTGLDQLINTVHILPFFPYSSDDGFSIIDFRQVDPAVGTWDDIRALGRQVDLMIDLVLNHVSQQSTWFQQYLLGNAPYDKYFIDVDPGTDLSSVTRPRSLPLLTPFETTGGKRHVWTTFSADQVDLNFTNPDVLAEMLDILLFYIQQGARVVRLDAIAFLWKQIGTSCIHLPKTHEIVKLMRDVVDAVAPHALLLTETNVPHEENTSYFGSGHDEAHMVYQFSLPPLLLDAFLSRDCRPLAQWLSDLKPSPQGTHYFNFTASHDGIGVRPLEGLVTKDRIEQLVRATQARGGLVSTRRDADGTDSPYELNIAYRDALGEPDGLDAELHARRFLASQAVMLALRGVPGIYFHSLVGSPNDLEGAQQSGQPRRINRARYQLDALMSAVSEGETTQARIFNGYKHLLKTRICQPAFHPDGAQEVCAIQQTSLLAFRRTSPNGQQRILVLVNLDDEPQQVELDRLDVSAGAKDLLGDHAQAVGKRLKLEPYQVAWLDG